LTVSNKSLNNAGIALTCNQRQTTG
jgi:hypothetical protein